jgi:DNA-binding winged helix-turn-helix (wHTH) protein
VTTPLDANPTANLLRFGAFELDIEAERLLRKGRSVRLQPQPFRLLCLLAGQAGRVVTREEIRAALWTSDTFVDFEQGVNFAIKQVREAIGEDADHPIYIQTIPKRGYKFRRCRRHERTGRSASCCGHTSRSCASPKIAARNGGARC